MVCVYVCSARYRGKEKKKEGDRKLPFEVGTFCISKDNHI